MNPTLLEGELVVVEKISKVIGRVEYGDILVVTYPMGIQCVKRVIGLEGDHVEIRENRIFLNNQMLEESYLSFQEIEEMGEYVVPQDHVFFVGDNRAHSIDSRNPGIGALHKDQIIGKVLFIIYPFERIESRWTSRFATGCYCVNVFCTESFWQFCLNVTILSLSQRE